jgi:hypothetical protein
MWNGMLGVAAAQKALTVAVGLSMLLGGTVAVETTGVGATVLDSVGVHQTANSQSVTHPTPTPEGTVAANAKPDGTALPGALVVQLHKDGSFTVRGQLVDGTDSGTAMVDIGADQPLSLTYDPATVHAAGRPAHGSATPTPEPVDLSNYIGYGVFVTGTCADNPLPTTLGDCQNLTVSRIQVLGQAGQHGAASQGAAHAQGNAADGQANAPEPNAAAGTHPQGDDASATPTPTPSAAGLSHRPER